MGIGKEQLAAAMGVLGSMAWIVCMGGCQSGFIFQEQIVRTADLLVVPGPFRPAVMRVHPLTHTEINAEGDAVMILHVELKDLWGDTVKGVGQLQVQIRKQNETSVIGRRGSRWDVDLRDIEINVSYFDGKRGGRSCRSWGRHQYGTWLVGVKLLLFSELLFLFRTFLRFVRRIRWKLGKLLPIIEILPMKDLDSNPRAS